MDDLDKKLEEILFGDTPKQFFSDDMLSKPEKIKQAFKDAGYIQFPEPFILKNESDEQREPFTLDNLRQRIKEMCTPHMSGQEWYGRFEEEYNEFRNNREFTLDKVFEAAKKASGIE